MIAPPSWHGLPICEPDNEEKVRRESLLAQDSTSFIHSVYLPRSPGSSPASSPFSMSSLLRRGGPTQLAHTPLAGGKPLIERRPNRFVTCTAPSQRRAAAHINHVDRVDFPDGNPLGIWPPSILAGPMAGIEE